MTHDLSGAWKVTWTPHGSDIGNILAPDFVPEGWLDARVPEDIRATLRRAGAIRGNTYDKREDEERWIEEADWIYYRRFRGPDDCKGPLLLAFDGLDTFCEIWLNGELLGRADNMFRPWRFDVTGRVLPGRLNRLVVRVQSAPAAVEGRTGDIFSITGSDRIFARKAQMSYGWDFCARCVTAGIWKGVRLESIPEPAMPEVYACTDRLEGDDAVVCVRARLPGNTRLRARLTYAGETAAESVSDGDGPQTLELRVARARLWWPRPYGGQPLYDLALTLLKDGDAVAERVIPFGIRVVEVVQAPQPDGLSFQFSVNGRRLFIRGANWVPPDTVFTSIADDDYETLIHYAVKGNLSMLRVWGGGIYEQDAFYDLCDRNGLLVWQDFMLACGIYPHDQAFLDNLESEAEYVVTRLRNHACLALWCGDNENGQAYIWANRAYEFDADPINHRVLKSVCARLDPRRFYLPTSPGSPNPDIRGGDNQESPWQGDVHLYLMTADRGVPANRDYGRNYYKRVLGYRPRFVSEFGFISLPGLESFGRFNPRRLPLRCPDELVSCLPMAQKYLAAGAEEALIHYSQLFNASALQYWIEHFRSLKGTCAGVLYWKFDDPLADCPDRYVFPSHMSAVDMYRQPRMTYYFTRRAYRDVLLCLNEVRDGVPSATLVNETQRAVRGRLTLSRRTFAGRILETRTMDAACPADSAVTLWVGQEDALAAPGDRFSEYLSARLDTGSEVLEARYLFADLDELDCLNMPDGKADIRAARKEDELAVTLRAGTYLRCLELRLADVRADFDDNYFDMDPGSERTVCIHPWPGARLEEAVLCVRAENLSQAAFPVCEMAGPQAAAGPAV